MSKRFPSTKRSIEALEAHDPDSPSRLLLMAIREEKGRFRQKSAG